MRTLFIVKESTGDLLATTSSGAASMPEADLLGFLQLASFAALLIGSVLAWVGVLKRASGAFPDRLLHYQGQPSALGFVDLVSVFILWIIGQAFAGSLFGFKYGAAIAAEGVSTSDQFAWLMIFSAVSQLLMLSVAVALISFRFKSVETIGIRFDRMLSDVRLAGVAFLCIVPGILLVQLLLSLAIEYKHDTLTLLRDDPTPLVIGACWLAAVFAAPIVEEFLFRGVLQGWLQRINSGALGSDKVLLGGWDSDTDSSSLPTVWPIFVTATLFALAHVGQGPAPVPLFLLGIGLGYLYRQTSSLLPCIGVHMLLNAYSMFWSTLAVI